MQDQNYDETILEDPDQKFIEENKKPKLTWSPSTENILVSWCDVARCYNWLHEKSFRKYNKLNYYFSIPIIILSTLAGTASISINGYVPSEYVNIAQLCVGAVNITTGIVTTLQNFFRYAQNSESHLNAAIGWSKLYRNIKIELSLEKNKRKNANEFVKISRAEYDRLMEQSPVIPADIINEFKKTIIYDNAMVLPDIVDNISHTYIYGTDPPANISTKETIHNFLKKSLSATASSLHHSLSQRNLNINISHPPSRQSSSLSNKPSTPVSQNQPLKKIWNEYTKFSNMSLPRILEKEHSPNKNKIELSHPPSTSEPENSNIPSQKISVRDMASIFEKKFEKKHPLSNISIIPSSKTGDKQQEPERGEQIIVEIKQTQQPNLSSPSSVIPVRTVSENNSIQESSSLNIPISETQNNSPQSSTSNHNNLVINETLINLKEAN